MAAFPTSPDILSKWYLFHLRVKLFLLSFFHVAKYSQLFHGFVTLADYNLFQPRVVHGFSTALVWRDDLRPHAMNNLFGLDTAG